MNTQPRLSLPLRITLASAAAALAISSLSGCIKLGGEEWAVTYEITTDAAAAHELAEVSYGHQENRGEMTTIIDKGTVSTKAVSTGGTLLKLEAIVAAKDRAVVTATPPAGVTATCRILLDGEREIAAATSAPGEAVSCDVDTPAFPR